MESRSRGALLSFVLLVLGSTLLPEPCDAWPRGYRPRHSRNASPEPRCPNCARDCPQNLAGDSISEINEEYQSLSPVQYSPVPQISYDALPPPAVYNPPQTLPPYNSQPVVATYAVSPPVASYSSQLPTESYVSPLPAPPYDPRLPPAPCNPPQTLTPPAEQPCYNCPPSTPASFNLLPKAQNRFQLWRRAQQSKFNRSPYAIQEYRSRLYPQESSSAVPAAEYDCDCGYEPKFQLDQMHEVEDDTSYGTYNRRSSEGEAPRVSRHYSHAHYAEAPSPPVDMYKTYLPYVREETPSDSPTDHTLNENERHGRERLYVVYRADALKSDQNSEDRPISERELETVIRKAIEIARQQRNQDNILRRRANQQHQYEHRLDPGSQRALRQGPHGQIRVVTEEGDETKNPGLDQNKWVAISALPKSDILADEEPNEARWKAKAPEVKSAAPDIRRSSAVDLTGDVETPQTATTATESLTFTGSTEEVAGKKTQ